MLTVDALLAAGFKEWKPGDYDRWTCGFQFRVRDKHGTRYFVQCYFWQHSRYGDYARDGWEVEVHYNDGCPSWTKGRHALRITAWAGVESWTPADVLEWADQLWQRLSPDYYERDE